MDAASANPYSHSKQRWSVVIGNVILASLAIAQFVTIVINKGSIAFLFVTFAFPGFCWYIQHRYDMTFLQAVLVCMGLNRDLKKIKGFLIGVFGGFFKGWYLMYVNTHTFGREKLRERRLKIDYEKMAQTDDITDLDGNDSKEQTQGKMINDNSDQLQRECIVEELTTEEDNPNEDELIRALLKSERTVRKGR